MKLKTYAQSWGVASASYIWVRIGRAKSLGVIETLGAWKIRRAIRNVWNCLRLSEFFVRRHGLAGVISISTLPHRLPRSVVTIYSLNQNVITFSKWIICIVRLSSLKIKIKNCEVIVSAVRYFWFSEYPERLLPILNDDGLDDVSDWKFTRVPLGRSDGSHSKYGKSRLIGVDPGTGSPPPSQSAFLTVV